MIDESGAVTLIQVFFYILDLIHESNIVVSNRKKSIFSWQITIWSHWKIQAKFWVCDQDESAAAPN